MKYTAFDNTFTDIMKIDTPIQLPLNELRWYVYKTSRQHSDIRLPLLHCFTSPMISYILSVVNYLYIPGLVTVLPVVHHVLSQ